MSAARMLLALVLSLAAGGAQSSPRPLRDMVSALQNLQVKVAAGDPTAQAEQIKQLHLISGAIANAPAETWSDAEELSALVIYLLGGGPPREVVLLLQRVEIPAAQQALVQGALDYAVGKRAEAAQRLRAIDARRLDARLAGQVAFTQSFLQERDDDAKSMELLEWARILSPGTLVEEAALRREILFLAKGTDTVKCARLAGELFDRFPNSPYASEFVPSLAGILSDSRMLDDRAFFSIFAPMLKKMKSEARAAFLLTLGRRALLRGRLDIARQMSAAALDGPLPAAGRKRAKLYLGAALLLLGGYEDAIGDLAEADANDLDATDKAIRTVAKSVAAHLYDDPLAREQAPSSPLNTKAPKTNAEESGAGSETIARIETALGRPLPAVALNGSGALAQ